MLNTKLEVDKHVESCLRRINSELERNLRYLAFAKLYYQVGAYDQALRYVNIYLNAKPTSADAQYFRGKTLERLGKSTQALEAYRLSLDLDSQQNNVVLKICELMAHEDNHFDASSARYFCEKAQNIDPSNPVIFHLKERLVAAASKDPNDVTNLLLKELEVRPLDVDVRVRLLRHLLQNRKTREAYTHAYDIEQKHLDVFLNSLTWYETVAEVLSVYRGSTNNVLTWEFWMMYVSVWDKLVSLSLNERTKSIEHVPLVLNFDQTLQIAADKLSACPQKQLVQEFWRHYTGQLCWHLTTLLYKQARKELIKYREAGQIGIPLLFASYNFKPTDLQGLWIEHATASCRLLMQRWNREAAFRCTQAGNMLKSIAHDRKPLILERGAQGVTGMWRDKTFKFLFITREHQNKTKSSYFVLTNHLLDVQVRLPDAEDLISYTKIAQLVHPNSLHHHIWLGLNINLADFECSVFPGLQFTVKTLTNCAAETLNVLDIQSFIYAAILCGRSQQEEQKHTIYFNSERPAVMPIACTDLFGTANQEKWLRCAYMMYTSQHSSDLSDVRMTLIRGIETIRCVGNHGLDAKLLLQLARLFAERATKVTKQSEIEANDARAELYWKTAMHLLEKYKRNEAISYASNRLFEHKMKDFNQDQVQLAINEGKLFLGKQAMKKKELEKAMNFFKNIRDPYASFHQAQIYKLMADKETNLKQENVTSEMRSQNIILLTKARDALYLTLDRLGMPGVDPKHPLNEVLGSEIEKFERLLSRIDPDNNRNECDGMSDDNVSSIESENFNYTMNRHESNNVHSTPFRLDHSRREARPSPERLDAQIRQLAASKDMALNRVLEQNKVMIDSQKALADELKSFRETVTDLTATINDLKSLKIVVEDVKEIKKTVDDLESLRSVSDMVYELRKEVAELKKESAASASTSKSKQNQTISEEDLYVLDDEYAAEFTNQHSVSSLSSTLYPNVAGRMNNIQNPMGYPTSPMYNYQMYPYAGMGGMGLPQLPGIAFPPPPTTHFVEPGTERLADYRSLLQGYSQMASAVGHQQPPTLPQQGLGQAQSFMPQQYQPQQPQPPQAQLPASVYPAQGTNLFGGHGVASSQMSFGALPDYSKRDSLTTVTTASATMSASRAAPVNVVITSSDPLPKTTATQQPILSVTIPPQHLKGNKVHNYQITLPSTMPSGAPSVLSQAPLVVSTQSMLSNVSAPVYSSLSDQSPKNNSAVLGLKIEKSLNNSFNNKSLNQNSDCDNSRDDEHDPCPDFKPIVPLPDEVPVNTGEENEIALFKERAKLFRFAVKEWKERGVGELKILKHKDTGKVRLLMRRDQVHKICANHYLESNMDLKPMKDNAKAYMWAANDYSEGEVVLEKFCVQFKTPELAKKFYNEFEKGKQGSEQKPAPAAAAAAITVTTTTMFSTNTSAVFGAVSSAQSATTNLGGFKFTSTPTFKPKQEEQQLVTTPVKQEIPEVPKTTASPFASFSFTSTQSTITSTATKPFSSFIFSTPTKEPNKSIFATTATPTTNLFTSINTSTFTPTQQSTANTTLSTTLNVNAPEMEKDGGAETEEYEPNVEFAPAVPLPDLIEVKTGEEDSQVLFESKAKLLRFDAATKEWKERGVGQMKVLKDATIVRLVMRREQVHKVCCNHQLLKSMAFKRMAKSQNAISWYARDFSDGVLNTEMFAIRFKTGDIADNFESVITIAQEQMDLNNSIGGTETESDTDRSDPSPQKKHDNKVKPIGFGDTFKPKPGDWECKNCFVRNEPKVSHCVACATPKNDAIAKSSAEDNNKFCFGVSKTQASSTGFSFGGSTTTTSNAPSTTTSQGFGNMFKPKEGSWECKECYTRNEGASSKCISCEAPQDGAAPAAVTTSSTGSTLKGVDLSTGGLSFSFGFQPPIGTSTVSSSTVSSTTPNKMQIGFGEIFKPKAGSWECKECYSRNDGDYCLSCDNPKDDTIPPKTTSNSAATQGVDLSTGGLKFSFGMPPATTTSLPSSFNFAKSPVVADKGFSFSLNAQTKENIEDGEQETVFGSPHKVGFEFTPRSPRRQSGGQQIDDETDNSYVEEEEANVYFKPVIPMPDKVLVTTGEEEEEVLYCHRAKLYRHTIGEWKERGIGDLKILFQKEQLKLRVLMRREQIHKICLNHVLTKDIDYRRKDDKTWLFNAPDFSEGEIESSSFCLRFKTPDVAENFIKAIISALKRIDDGDTNATVEETDSDVEFVSETVVSAEEEQEAEKLMLPPKFMAYRQLADCTCEQCKKEDQSITTTISNTTITTTNCTLTPSKSSFFSCGTPIATPTSLFGTPSNMSGGFSFGSGFSGFNNTSTMALFGSTKTTPQDSTPGTPDSSQQETLKDLLVKNSVKPSLFGNSSMSFGSTTTGSGASTPLATVAEKKSIFGAFATPPAATSTSIFGKPAMTSTFSGGSLFGAAVTGGSVFNTSGNIFGGTPKSSTPETSTSFSFANIAKNAEAEADAKITTDSAATTTKSTFSFAAFGIDKGTAEGGFANLSSDELVLTADANMSFASLAANAENMPFGKPKGDTDNPFAKLGAGAPVFGSASKPKSKANTSQQEDDDDAGEDHDPHYDPIVPLPDEIELKTGEEDEEVMFSERGKLYRFTNKEWKERGVGNVKVLYHPKKNTYRLLLRREAIHKVVLNQLITPNLEVMAFTLSSNAWMWVGMNFSDEGHVLEKLAVRFKNETLSQAFYAAATKAINGTKATSATNVAPVVAEVVDTHASDVEDEEEEDDDYDEEDDDRFVMITCECALYEQSDDEWVAIVVNGLAEIIYDRDSYASRIIVTNDAGMILSNTVIATNTQMERKPDDEGCELHWRAVEYADDRCEWRMLKMKFDSPDATESFYMAFLEGKSYADQANIVDEIPIEGVYDPYEYVDIVDT